MSLTRVVDEFPLFKDRKEKERFLLVLGLLASRTITLAKAAEVLGMSRLEFSAVLDTMGFRYSYLDEEEAQEEVNISRKLKKKSAN